MAKKLNISAFSSSEELSSSLTVECPSCHTEFEVGDSLLATMKAKAEKDIELRRQVLNSEIQQKNKLLEERETTLKLAEKTQQLLIDEQVESQLTAQYPELLRKARESAKAYAMKDIISLQSELDSKAEEVTRLQEEQGSLLKAQRELKAERDRFELEKQKAISEALDEESKNLRELIGSEYSEKLLIQNLEIERAKRTIEELNQKLKTKPSQELQGEASEIDLETKLKDAFSLDQFNPVSKGQRGADIHQVVVGHRGQPSGSIVWEVKRAQNWGGDWIKKLKDDQLEARASIAVLVSQATPPGIDSFDIREGVWIVKPAYAVVLALALREGIIQTSEAQLAVEGMETKATMVYQYLTSDNFKSRFGSILHTGVVMQQDLNKEKARAEKQFKAREKQLERLVKSTWSFIGDLQGIAGQDLKALEEMEIQALPEREDEEVD